MLLQFAARVLFTVECDHSKLRLILVGLEFTVLSLRFRVPSPDSRLTFHFSPFTAFSHFHLYLELLLWKRQLEQAIHQWYVLAIDKSRGLLVGLHDCQVDGLTANHKRCLHTS